MKRLLVLTALLCSAAAPPTYTLTEDEAGQVDKGKVAIRHITEGDSLGGVVAFVDVDAPPATVLDAVMDLEARKADNSSIDSIEIYMREGEKLGAKWTLTVMGSTIVFHAIYECHRAEGYCTYALDPTKENDLVASEGHYVVLPHATGTRLVYASRTDTGRSVPGWIKRWIAGSSLTSQVEGIRDRARVR